MNHPAISAHSADADTRAACQSIAEQLGAPPPQCLVFFASPNHDGQQVRQLLERRFPSTAVVGCSTNGEFTDRGFGTGGLAVLALDRSVIEWSAVVCADLGEGVDVGVRRAAADLSAAAGKNLREVDPAGYVGLALLDGARGEEEKINQELGNVAPLLSFVGGSAGDNIQFKETWVHGAGRSSNHGVALLLLKPRVPHLVMKTCNFTAGPRRVTITKADPARRLVHEIDGHPAVPYYAELTGAKAEEMGFPHFLAHPLGLMIDGEPWLRSVVRIEPPSSLFFACGILEGMALNVMEGGDLVEDTRRALERARATLGAEIGAGIFFNCAYRMLEAQFSNRTEDYHRMLSGFPLAGCQSNGESWLGHINQTLTGLLFRQPA